MLEDEKKLSYWNQLYSSKDFFGIGPTKLAKLAESLLIQPHNMNVLEIGCGQGRDAIYFSQLGCQIHAFDISTKAVDYVSDVKKSLKLKNLNVFTHDVEIPLPFKEETFDFAYSNLALQFFDIVKLAKIFANISRVMKKNSLFLFSTKKSGDKYYDFGNKINKNAFEYKGITRYFFDQSELTDLLVKHFEIINFENDSHVNLDSTISMWWKILVRKI